MAANYSSQHFQINLSKQIAKNVASRGIVHSFRNIPLRLLSRLMKLYFLLQLFQLSSFPFIILHIHIYFHQSKYSRLKEEERLVSHVISSNCSPMVLMLFL